MSPIVARVKDYMMKDVATTDVDSTVIGPIQTMAKRHIGSVVVTEKGNPVGIITERDIINRVLAKNLRPDEVKVREVMSSPLITIMGDASLFEASELMMAEEVRRLVVTDEEGKMVGIYTERDLVSSMMDIFLALAGTLQIRPRKK